MSIKITKAKLTETIRYRCPVCETLIEDIDPTWREKPDNNGKSYISVYCPNMECKASFYLDFN